MTKLFTLIGAAALLFLGSCGIGSSSSGSLVSCYDTGFGVKCVPTPDGINTNAVDIDGDGNPDSFVCGDNDEGEDNSSADDGTDDSSADDGADDEADDGTGDLLATDGEDDGDDDSDADDDSDSSEDDGASCGAAHDDGDDDGVSDEMDCDCTGQTPDDPTTPTDPGPVG